MYKNKKAASPQERLDVRPYPSPTVLQPPLAPTTPPQPDPLAAIRQKLDSLEQVVHCDEKPEPFVHDIPLVLANSLTRLPIYHEALAVSSSLHLAGLFPDFAGQRNVRVKYFYEMGIGAYYASATYWSAKKKHRPLAKYSEAAAERFFDLVETLRGMRNTPHIAEQLFAIDLSRVGWN